MSGMDQCQIPWCEEPQEFKSEEARCITHSLEWFFFWTPLAEFGPIQSLDTDTEQ